MKKRIKRSAVRLYLHFLTMHLRAAMEYKTSFWMSFFGMTLTSLASFFAIWILFNRFHTVNGYTFAEVLLCYTTLLIGFSITEIFMRGFDLFASQVQSGSFDRLLLRPRSPLFSVLVSRMEFARIGRLLEGVLLFCYAASNAEIQWDLQKGLVCGLMMLGSVIFFSGLMLLQAGVCFFTIEGLEVMNIFTHGSRELGSYPLDIYSSHALILFFTFFIPLACAQYYPFLYLTGHSDSLLFAFSPVFTIVFFILCYLVWKCGVRHYQSTGS